MEYDILLEMHPRPMSDRQFSHGMSHRYDPVTIALVGTAASASAGTAATAGIIGAGGAITAAGVGTAAAVAGGALSAFSTIQQGQAAKAQGKAEEKIAEFNADQQRKEAKSRMQAAELKEERVSRQEKITKAEQRVAFAKSGISINESSSLNVLLDTASQFAQDRALTLREGVVGANALNQQASLTIAGGKLASDIGDSKATASMIKAGGTILTTAVTAQKGMALNKLEASKLNTNITN
jgi:hypothetical protein